MAHTPHLYLPGPWTAPTIPLAREKRHHLERVLRRGDGAPVTYTDGAGARGRGRLVAGTVERGTETRDPLPGLRLTLAVATPNSTDRVRFLVEKSAEFGVAKLVWFQAAHGGHRSPPAAKAGAWAEAALEQSRGAWKLELAGPVGWDDLAPPVVVADPDGGPWRTPAGTELTVVVGPEGGFAADEIPAHAARVSLGPNVLRVETAALAIAALVRVGCGGE